MAFKMLLLPPFGDRPPPEPFISDDWPEKIRAIVPGAEVKIFADWRDAKDDIADADAAYGMVTPELLPLAKKLKWIMAPGAGLGPEYYYEALNQSDIVVTNPRAIQAITWPRTPWPSCSPSRGASTSTCRARPSAPGARTSA